MPGRLKDPVSGLTHALGAVLSVAGLMVLVYAACTRASGRHVAVFAVFGAGLVLAYTASTLYHLLPLGPSGSRLLRRIDHIMIFVLIAGTYTPVCVLALGGPWGWSLLACVWGLVVVGAVLKLVWLQAPRWLSVSLYLFMGWLVVVAIWPLYHALPPGALGWLAAGGLLYSAGALIYAIKRPNFLPGLVGFHELFHLLVMGGSLSHFWLMYRYIMNLG
ncbi:MAG: hemolysin III family protein [Bacillota bacterium]